MTPPSGPTTIEQLFTLARISDPTLSSGTAEGIRVERPVLRLFATKVEAVQGTIRRARAVIGHDEASIAQLTGAVVRFRSDQRDGVIATWGQLRTAADAELVRDALGPHELDGAAVVYDAYVDELLTVHYPTPRRDVSEPPIGLGFRLVKGTWATKVSETRMPARPIAQFPCSLCDNVDYGSGRLCKRHWRADCEANLATFEALNLKQQEPLDEHNTPPPTSRGISADPTGDRASTRADTGEVDALIRDELLTPSQARVVELSAAGWNLHEIGREMGTSAPTVLEHLKRARGKLNPRRRRRRRRLTWREEMARSVPVVKVKRRQPSRSLLAQDSEVSQRRQYEVVCPLCQLIVRRGLIRDGACSTCSETFSDSLSTNVQLGPLSKWQGTSPLFLATV